MVDGICLDVGSMASVSNSPFKKRKPFSARLSCIEKKIMHKLNSEDYIQCQLKGISDSLDWSYVLNHGSDSLKSKFEGIDGDAAMFLLWDCKRDVSESTYFNQRDIEVPLGELEFQKEPNEDWSSILEDIDNWTTNGNLAYTTCMGCSIQFDEKELDQLIQEHWENEAQAFIEDNFYLLFTDGMGTAIPKAFCEDYGRWNIDQQTWQVCLDGNIQADNFWDAWMEIEEKWRGVVQMELDQSPIEVGIFQSGDLWAFDVQKMEKTHPLLRDAIWNSFS